MSTAHGRAPRPGPAPGDAEAGRWGGEPYARALRTGRGPLLLRWDDGFADVLPVERWCAPADAADLRLLAACGPGPLLDLGCGPGRLVAAAQLRGTPSLGVDPAPAAAAATRARGGAVLRRSVFDRLPGEGRWPAVLLADGNIGIGGDPVRLLGRAAALLAPGGRAVVETAPDTGGPAGRCGTVRIEDGAGRAGEPFPWCRPDLAATVAAARSAGLRTAGSGGYGGRRFLLLRKD